MKIRGIEIAIAVWNQIPAIVGVIPLDIEVPDELAKTNWTPLQVIVTVLTSSIKSSETIRVNSTEQDPNFRIDENMIRAATAELNKRIEATRLELVSSEAADDRWLQALGAVQDALLAERWEEGKRLVANLQQEGPRG